MKRFFLVFVSMIITVGLLLGGCSSKQIDRGKELKQAMDTCDSKWSQSFPEGSASFKQVADYIAGWGENAGLEVTKKSDHYIVLTNKATKGYKKAPSVTLAVNVDPAALRDSVSRLSLGMTSLLGPIRHGRISLIVTEAAGETYPGADSISGKYLDCDHFIYLYSGGSAMVYTSGPMSARCELSCDAPRVKPSYDNAYKIRIRIPETADAYVFDKDHAMPNPVNVLGDLLASAKSSGRLFEIASFTAEENGDFLPSKATAVVVVDDNNVEAFQKRFDTSYEAFEKRFDDLDLEKDEEGNVIDTFKYVMKKTRLPNKVLKQSASDNIISLMYTLQTGINSQDEETGAITAASYIRSLSTEDEKLSLMLDLRSRDESSMDEMSSNFLITSGLCEVDSDISEAHRLWSSASDSSLAAWFIASVNDAAVDTTGFQSSECDTIYEKNTDLDMVAYRYDKSHRATALENIIDYLTSLSGQK